MNAPGRIQGGAPAQQIGQGSALDPLEAALPDPLDVLFRRFVYGLRVLASVALAMWVAFWLQLDNPFWAPISAAIVCQPTIGASLRKGQFRILGTFTGALAIVLLTAAMPQSRIGLLAGLTVWGGLAGFAATLLRNNAAYAASLAGYTAIIVFGDIVSTSPDQAFTLAVTRATEISIGVLSAGFVLALTDRGEARRRLYRAISGVIGETASGLGDTLALRTEHETVRTHRRALIRRVAELDPLTDEALGESSQLRYRTSTLQGGLEGLFEAISAWRGVSEHLQSEPTDSTEDNARALLSNLPELHALDWSSPVLVRQTLLQAAAVLETLPVRNASEKLLADLAQDAMRGLASGANALALLQSPGQAAREHQRAQIHVPDLLPALINALRVVTAMILASVIWIEAAWPGGQGALTFAAVVTILFGPLSERAPRIVHQFAAGVTTASALASIVAFAVLPGQQSFFALVLAIGIVLVPNAMLAAGQRQKSFFVGINFIFLALLAPTNLASYDVAGFFNNALPIVIGVMIAVATFHLIPPMAGTRRAQRLVALTLRDVRRLAAGRRRTRRAWLGLLTARLSTMPDAGLVPQAQLVAAISAGNAIIWFQRHVESLTDKGYLQLALADIAAGRVRSAQSSLTLFAHSQSTTPVALRAEGEALLLRDVLNRHMDYFAA